MLRRMYVCVCNGHRDCEIREAAQSGLRCARTIYAHLGKPPRCGRCLDLATMLIEQVHDGVPSGAAATRDARAGDVCLGNA